MIVPDNCIKPSDSDRLYGIEYVKLIESIKLKCFSNCDLSGYDKVFFSRGKLKHSRDIGEESIVKFFKKAGYMIIYPERLPLVVQIGIMQQCRFFASTEGSIAHLSLFCKPGTNVILINKADYINSHQVMINEFADLNVTYIEAHHSSLANRRYPWWGPFYLYPSRFMFNFFGKTGFIHHFFRPDYWYYLLKYNNLNSKAKPIVNRIISCCRSFLH